VPAPRHAYSPFFRRNHNQFRAESGEQVSFELGMFGHSGIEKHFPGLFGLLADSLSESERQIRSATRKREASQVSGTPKSHHRPPALDDVAGLPEIPAPGELRNLAPHLRGSYSLRRPGKNLHSAEFGIYKSLRLNRRESLLFHSMNNL